MFEDVFANPPPSLMLAIAAGVVLVGGFIRGFVGFGGALLIIPTLAVIFTPKEAVALHLMMEIPSGFQLMPSAARACEKSTVMPVLIGLVVATPIGAYALSVVDPQPMRIAISVFALVMVGLLATNWRYPGTINRAMMGGVGIVGGLVQGSTGIGGPPVTAVLLSRRDDDDTTRGNVLLLMGSLVVIAIPIQWYLGILTEKTFVYGMFAGLVYVTGTYFGSRYYVLGGQRIYRLAALSVLGAIGALSLVHSLR